MSSFFNRIKLNNLNNLLRNKNHKINLIPFKNVDLKRNIFSSHILLGK